MKSKFLGGYKSRGFFYGGFDFKDIDYEKEIEENVLIEDIIM